MKPSTIKAIIAIYAVGFWITFGASIAHNPQTESTKYGLTAVEKNNLEGIGCAFGWPLYWSYRTFNP